MSLFLVDEMHLLGGAKGPALEICASRMRYIAAQTDAKIRIVALSHSLANARDVGEWIGATSHGLFNFPPGVRPVPLEIHIQGLDIVNFEARMQVRRRGAAKPLPFLHVALHDALHFITSDWHFEYCCSHLAAGLPVWYAALCHAELLRNISMCLCISVRNS